MSLQDAQNYVNGHLLQGHLATMPAPQGQMTKTINGKTQTVSAAEAWQHPSTVQTDVPTVKTFLAGIVEEFHKRGEVGRSLAGVQILGSF